MTTAIEQWERGRVPLVNAVSYADGKLVLLTLGPGPGGAMVVKPVADSTLASFLRYNPSRWVKIYEWASVELPDGRRAVCGGGTFEEDGFLAILDADGGLVYSIFLDFPGPLSDLRFLDDALTAVTEDARWTFDLVEPWRIRFEEASGHG